MRSLFVSLVVSLAIGIMAEAKELRVTNAADFVNCAAGLPLVAGPDVGQTALAGDTCVVQPGGYVAIVTVTVQNLKLLANIGAMLNGQIVIQANGVQIGAPGQGFTVNCGACGGPAIVLGAGATQNITIEENTISSANGDAIASIPALGDLRAVRILKNQLRSTAPLGNGLGFFHTGSLEDVVIEGNSSEINTNGGVTFGHAGRARKIALSNNRINSNPGGGIIFLPAVRDSEEIEIARNTIRGNTLGVAFGNTGGLERISFSGNTISANSGVNVGFANTGFISNLEFNGDDLSNTTTAGAVGVVILNGSTAERLSFKNVLIERNRGHGIRISNGGRLRDAQFISARIRNNAGHNIFVQHSLPGTDFGVSNLLFQDSVIEQADDNGVRILTDTAEIESVIFKNLQMAKNRGLGACLRTNTGTLSNILIENSTVQENQGGTPGTTACDMAPQASGSGMELLTLGGAPVSNINATESVFANNGGFGLRIEAFGMGEVGPVAVRGSRFVQNGTRAAMGLGSGLRIRAELVRDISVNPTVALDNNDHGIEISASRDIIGVSVSGGEFSNNDRNNDNVGAGISVSANGDLLNLGITGVKLKENTQGLRVQADKLTHGQITRSEIINNRQAGVQAVLPTLGELDATNNYWGSPSGPSGTNGAVGQVQASPFLSAPPGGGPTPPTPPTPPPPPAGDFIVCAAGTEGKIDDLEMLGIIDAWIKAQSYQTCGVPSDSDVLRALGKWISGA